MRGAKTAGNGGGSIGERLFVGTCTAAFLALVGGVAQALYLYWR